MATIIRAGPQPSDLDVDVAFDLAHARLGDASEDDIDPSDPVPASKAGAEAAPAEEDARRVLLGGSTEAEQKGRRPLDPNHVGIVCLHGIGDQKAGQTLLEWTDPIIRAVVAWRKRHERELVGAGGPIDGVERAQIDFNGATLPVVKIHVPGRIAISARVSTESDGRTTTGSRPHAGRSGIPSVAPQTWTFTEAWWAASVESPSLRTMVDWNGRDGVLAQVVTQVLTHNTSGHPTWMKALGRLGLRVFVSTIGSIALLGYLALAGVAGILPIPGLKDSAVLAGLNGFLVGWWGDARVLVRDPVQAANVRGRLVGAIRALRSHGCGSLVVIAHSGGTIVAFQTLQDPAYPKLGVDKLITHGEAIGLARLFGDDRVGRWRDQIAPAAIRLDHRPGGPRTRVTRWRDFWGSHDPAPNGKLAEMSEAGQPKANEFRLAYPIWNRMSIREDHGGYWSNDEEFVLRVIRELDTATVPVGQSRFEDPGFPDDAGSQSGRRHERVLFRSVLLRTSLVAPVVAILAAIALRLDTLGRPTVVHELVKSALDVWTKVPIRKTVDELLGWLAGWLSGLGASGFLVNIGVGTVAFLAAIGVGFAMLPAGRWATWKGPGERALGVFADLGLTVAVVAASIWVVIAALAWHVIPARLVGPGVAGLGVAIGLLAWLNAAGWVAKHVRLPGWWMAQVSLQQAIRTGIVVPLVGFALVGLVSALLLDRGVAEWAIASAVVFLAFQVVVRLIGWRWTAWDDRERQAIVETRAIGNRSMAYLELGAMILASAGLVAVIGFGQRGWFGLLVSVFMITALVAIIRDTSAAERPA